MQLYKAHVARTLRQSGAQEHSVWITNADREELVERVLAHILEADRYVDFRVTSIERIKPCAYMVSRRIEKLADDPAADNSGAREARTNQPRNLNAWALGIGAVLTGRDVEHVLRRAGLYLLALGEGAAAHAPFFDGYQLHVEELGAVDCTAVSTVSERIREAEGLWDAQMVRVSSTGNTR